LPILQVFRRCRLMYDDDGNEMPRKKRAKKNWNHCRASGFHRYMSADMGWRDTLVQLTASEPLASCSANFTFW
jgi:hypothetical protein